MYYEDVGPLGKAIYAMRSYNGLSELAHSRQNHFKFYTRVPVGYRTCRQSLRRIMLSRWVHAWHDRNRRALRRVQRRPHVFRHTHVRRFGGGGGYFLRSWSSCWSRGFACQVQRLKLLRQLVCAAGSSAKLHITFNNLVVVALLGAKVVQPGPLLASHRDCNDRGCWARLVSPLDGKP